MPISATIAVYTQEGARKYFANSTWPLIVSAGIGVRIEVRRCRLHVNGERSVLTVTDGKYLASHYVPRGNPGRGQKAREGCLVHTDDELKKAVLALCLRHGYSREFFNGVIQQVEKYEYGPR